MQDQQEFDLYQSKVGATLAGHPVKVLAAYGPQETLEGEGPEGVVIVEFPSKEAAHAWYHGPEYQAVAQHRFRARAIAPCWSKASERRAYGVSGGAPRRRTPGPPMKPSTSATAPVRPPMGRATTVLLAISVLFYLVAMFTAPFRTGAPLRIHGPTAGRCC